MKFKKILSFLVVGCLATGSLVGCGSGNKEGGKSGDASNGGVVNLEIWQTFSDVETDVFDNKIIPAFNEKYPDIKIKSTRMPSGSDFNQQLVQAISGGSTPDLARVDITDVAKYAKLGALSSVDDAQGFADIKKELYEGPMSTSLYNGKYYGIPLDTNTKIAIYNKELLNKAGLTEAPKTFDELIKAGEKIKGAETFPLSIQNLQVWAWEPYFLSFGGKYTDDSNTKATGYLNSPESIAALTKISDLYKEGMIGQSVIGGLGTWEGIKGNNYMMIDEGPWWFAANKDFKDNVVYGPMPTVNGKSVSVVGGEDTVIFNTCKNKDAANKFAQFLASDEAQTIFAEELEMIPVNTKTAEKDIVTGNPLLKTYVDQLNHTWARTPSPNWSEIDTVLQKTFEKVLRGEAEPKEALDEAATQVDALLQS